MLEIEILEAHETERAKKVLLRDGFVAIKDILNGQKLKRIQFSGVAYHGPRIGQSVVFAADHRETRPGIRIPVLGLDPQIVPVVVGRRTALKTGSVRNHMHH